MIAMHDDSNALHVMPLAIQTALFSLNNALFATQRANFESFLCPIVWYECLSETF